MGFLKIYYLKTLEHSDVFDVCNAFISKMRSEKWLPDAIMGIQSGGGNPALLMKYILLNEYGIDLDFVQLKISAYNDDHTRKDKEEIGYWNTFEGRRMLDPRSKRYNKLLVVDDIIETGGTMEIALKHADKISRNIRVFAVCSRKKHTRMCGSKVDIGMVLRTKKWVSFPWERDSEMYESFKT